MRSTAIDPAGSRTETTISTGDSVSTRLPDGTLITTVQGPDPRFGMQAATPQTVRTTLPSGLTSVVRTSRTVTMRSADDPLSLIRRIDSTIANGRVYTSTYDSGTRTITRRSPEGRESATVLDLLGRVVEERVPGVAATTYAYDSRGRLSSTRQGGKSIAYAYDELGRVATVTAPDQSVTRFTYDSVGRVTRVAMPGDREVAYAYDVNGNLASLTPPGQPAHRFGYGTDDLVERYDPPSLGTLSTPTLFGFDADRRVVSATRPDGGVVSYSLDDAARLSGITLPGARAYDFQYDARGQVTGMTGPDGGMNFAYDGQLGTSATWTGTVSGSVVLKYDADFRISVIEVNGQQVALTYDRDGLLAAAGDLRLTRNATSGILEVAQLGDVGSRWAHDSLGALSMYQVATSSDSLFAASYERDVLGRITKLTEAVQGQRTVRQFGYDAAGRLATVTQGGATVAAYEYDANGNRVRLTTPTGTVSGSYDAQDRLLSYGDAQYEYSRAGELTRRIVGADTTFFSYDAAGNLLKVALPGGKRVEYVVDAQNRRIGRRVDGGIVSGLLYENALAPAAELDAAGQVVSRFVYGTRPNVPEYMVRGGATYRLVLDHLGSVRLVVDAATGAVAQRLDYDEFGRVTRDTRPGFQPFGYAGGVYDAATGLVRFGARDYDAATGRWMKTDPKGFDGGSSNVYGYSRGDPINFVDPTGEIPIYIVCRPLASPLGVGGDHCGIVYDYMGTSLGIELLKNDLTRNVYFETWNPHSHAKKNGREYTYKPIMVDLPATHDEIWRIIIDEMARRTGSEYKPWGRVNCMAFVYQVVRRAGGKMPESAAGGRRVRWGICGGGGPTEGTCDG